MLNRILVPLDGSALAERALTLATALSIPTAARLILLRVVSAHTFPGVDPREPQVRALAEAEVYLREVAADLVQRGFIVDLATPYGEDAAGWILDEVGLRRANLIVMTTHGRTGPGRWLFGSVAEDVVSRSPVPVLLQRAWDPGRRSILLGDGPRLLVPLDGSTFSASALPVAAELADDLGAEVVQFHAESGDPATEIANAASESHIALVVMATHARTGIVRSALGSVAGRVLQEGTVPLVLMRPGLTNDQDAHTVRSEHTIVASSSS